MNARPIAVERPVMERSMPPAPVRRTTSGALRELVRALRIIGAGRLRRLRRAHRFAWSDTMNGFYTTRIVQALLTVGFFDELVARGTVDPAAFAAARNLDAGVLASLAGALYAQRLLDRRGDGYALSSSGRLVAEVARGWFNGVYGYEGVFHNLEAMLRKERRYGENLTRDAGFVALGSGEIEDWVYFPLAIEATRRAGARHVLDLGCGEGTFLRHLCQARPDVSGYGIDLAPEAIADGQAKLPAAGLEGRIRLLTQDMRELREAPAGFGEVDFATCFFVLHELRYDGVACVVEFLQTFRRLFPGVPLMVFEVDRPSLDDMRRRPGMAIPYYLQHDLSHQQPLAAGEWGPILEEAGFRRIDERRLGYARSVVFTVS